MTSKGNLIAKNTMYLYVRMFLIMLVSLYTVRVVVNTLGLEDYGIFNAVGGIVLILSFLSQTVTFATQRYFSYELGRNNLSQLQKVFSLSLVIYCILAVLIFLLAEIIGIWFVENKMIIPPDRLSAAKTVFHFSLLTFICSIVATPFNAIIIARENMKIYAYISIAEVFLKLSIVYLLKLDMFDKLSMYGILTFAVSFLINTIYIIYAKRSYAETYFVFVKDYALVKELLSYSSWTMFGTLASAANNQGLSILLNMFFGPIANASQTVARQIGHALQMFSGNIYTAVRPPMIKSFAEGEMSHVMSLFYKSSKLTFYLLYVIMLPLMLEMNYVITIWLGEATPQMVHFSNLTLIYTILLSLSNPISIIAQAANKVKIYHGIVDSFTLSSLILIYCAFKVGYDAIWAFIIIVVIFAIAHVIRLIILRKIIDVSLVEYLKYIILPILLVICMSLLPMSIIKGLMQEGVLRLFVVIISSTIVSLTSIWFIGLSKSEKSYVKDIIHKAYERFVL